MASKSYRIMDGGVTIQFPLYWFCLLRLFGEVFFDNLDSAVTKIWISRILYASQDKEVHEVMESRNDRFLSLGRLSEFCVDLNAHKRFS